MRAVRALDVPGRRNAYVVRRIREQARWYGRKSSAHRRAATRRFWITTACQLLAVVSALAALHLVEEHDAASLWLRIMALFASLGIAVTAWTQLNRDDELARAYASSLQELSLIAATAERASDQQALGRIVREGEEAIGRENRLWVTRRSEQLEDPEFGKSE
jgi:hypothetical protein